MPNSRSFGQVVRNPASGGNATPLGTPARMSPADTGSPQVESKPIPAVITPLPPTNAQGKKAYSPSSPLPQDLPHQKKKEKAKESVVDVSATLANSTQEESKEKKKERKRKREETGGDMDEATGDATKKRKKRKSEEDTVESNEPQVRYLVFQDGDTWCLSLSLGGSARGEER